MLVEFVSANPTGPLTAASGRHAAYGDSVARTLEASGAEVAREYYVNDAGGQVERFGLSIAARMKGEPPPEDGYGGEYVAELARRIEAEGVSAEDTGALARRGAALMRDQAAATLERYGVSFDRWFSESDLHAEGGAMDRALADLERAGHVYESEGATWLRTTSFGDDKDRVLRRSDGEPTYFLADVAYHRDKLERGDWTINVLGADHHGYVQRLKAGVAALGYDTDRLQIEIIQLVHVIESGERVQMSKRRGEFVTPRRADRRHRRRRRALLHAPAQPRDARSISTSTSRAASRARTPSTTSSTRTRGSRASCARPARTRSRPPSKAMRRPGRLSSPPSGPSPAGSSSSPRRSRLRPSAARPTASAPTRWPPPPSSTASTATARW